MNGRIMKTVTMASLLVAGCDASPLRAFFQESFGVGQAPLKTDQYVQEIAPNLPLNVQYRLNGGMSISSDGSKYAYSAGDMAPGQIHLGETGKPAKSISASASGYLWWSPDNRHIAFAVGQSGAFPAPFALKVMDTDSGSVVTVADSLKALYPWLSWSPDGQTLVFADEPPSAEHELPVPELYRVSLNDPRAIKIADIRTESGIPGAYWEPDSKRILYCTKAPGFNGAQNVVEFDILAGSSRIITRIPVNTGLVPSVDGQSFGYIPGDPGNMTNSSGNWEVHKVRLSDGTDEVTPFSLGAAEFIKQADGSMLSPINAARGLSPDLKWCIVTRGNSALFARDLATGVQFQLTSGSADFVAWTSDGKAIFARTTKGSVSHFYRVQVVR